MRYRLGKRTIRRVENGPGSGIVVSGTKSNGRPVTGGTPQELIQGIKAAPWMTGQQVHQVCEQYQTGRVSHTLEDRAARQRDRPKG